MNDMVTKAVVAGAVENSLTAANIWLTHRMRAVQEFIKNVTVIDDEPVVGHSTAQLAEATVLLPPDDDGLGTNVPLAVPSNDDGQPQVPIDVGHSLNVREVSDAFADLGVACAFVLPEKTKDSNAEDVLNRIVKASKLSDMVIVDWHMREPNPNLTKRVLTSIAKQDIAENGRLRLICVYTGQDVGPGILEDAKGALVEGGIELSTLSNGPDRFSAKAAHCMLIVLSKKSVAADRLPEVLLKEFAELSDGVLPSFALAAVGAIRKNAHHMVTRFGPELDSAFVANRMITDPPDDVADMLRDLFVAECDSALGLEGISDRYLGAETLLRWIAAHKLPIKDFPYKINEVEYSVNNNALERLLKYGVNNEGILGAEGEQPQPLPNKKRNLVSHSLAKTEELAHGSERKFARLVAMRREAFGDTKLSSDEEKWRPALTTGTLLVSVPNEKDSKQQWLLCLTPVCDTVRLRKSKRFTFFLASESETKKANLIVVSADGKEKKLYFDTEHPHFFPIPFTPDSSSERVLGVDSGEKYKSNPIFVFSETNSTRKYKWCGEIRYARATKIIGELIGNWGRLGINDSEFLRLVEKGDLSIQGC